MLDLNDITLFVHVVRVGSFTGAGRELGVPKSTVSRRVSKLEERLGVRLLQRTTRKLRLTEAGETYYARCRRAVEDLEEAERAIEELGDEPRGLLRVTGPFASLPAILGPVIRRYLAAWPDVHVELELTDRLVDLVAEGFDVAVRGGELADSSLVAKRLVKDRAVLLACPDYLARRGAPKTPEELAQHDLICFPRARADTTWTLTDGQRSAEVRFRARLSCNSSDLAAAATKDGLGIALLPFTVSRLPFDVGGLVRVLPAWSAAQTSGISVVYPSRRQLAPKVRAFIDLLEAHMRELLAA